MERQEGPIPGIGGGAEPRDRVEKHGFFSLVFNRNRAACIDEIERLASMIKSIDKWSAGTTGRDELYVDGGFGLSDERLYYFSYTDNTIFYQIISMDPETEKVNVEFYFAALSATDMEYIRSLKDSKDGFKY